MEHITAQNEADARARAVDDIPPIPPITPMAVAQLAPVPVDVSRIMERFQKLRPMEFNGLNKEPLHPTVWILEMEKTFSVLECTVDYKIRCATYMLKGEADVWWRSTQPNLSVAHPDLTWEQFQEAFFENYFSKSYRERKATKIMKVTQGSKLILEYQQKFEELFYFAPAHLKTDIEKGKRFEKVLWPGISSILVSHGPQTYSKMVQVVK
ncbi:uncharacterized protein LOC122663028 [Telopea speciosissima]|uniref:uncharacterized protein LOC122663028 n=1 Tax=Telopea speciosissima TaxID=54955 RepID=UPI001CC55F99|nr:uncharacterized protein LOC122663028 [Telopea speciosissima]